MPKLMANKYLTRSGADRRCAFENAHSRRWRFVVVRCTAAGKPDADPFDAARFSEYTWRLERISRNGGKSVFAVLNLPHPDRDVRARLADPINNRASAPGAVGRWLGR